jgi:AAA-like domain
MDSKITELSWEQTRQIIDDCMLNHSGKHLTDLEIDVLHGAWLGKSYEEIAEGLFLSVSYINKDVGYRLWKRLSEALGEEVNKKSFRQALQRRDKQPIENRQISKIDEIKFPDGFVPLESKFYVERELMGEMIQSKCDQEILKPGALIRIRAPRLMGKTSLLNRILARTEAVSYRTVRLNLRNTEKTVFSTLDKFLRWFCANVSRQLDLEPHLNDYWDEEIGSKVSCTGYFQSYILEELDTNLVISLDEIDTIFNYPDIAEDFLALLREWHEEAALEMSWQKLRLVISHATEVYISLNIYQSPFNVGVPIELPYFTDTQVTELARLYGLNWMQSDTEHLMAMVGGHPYLIQLAFYYLSHQRMTLSNLLNNAPTHGGVYCNYLRGCLERIKKQPELAIAVKQILSSEPTSHLEPIIVYQLDSLGIIRIEGNRVMPSCELYRQYFGMNI